MSKSVLRLFALLAALALLAAACGDSDDDDAADSGTEAAEEDAGDDGDGDDDEAMEETDDDADADADSGSDEMAAGVCSAGAISEIFVISPFYQTQPANQTATDTFIAAAEATGYNVNFVDANNDYAVFNSEMENAVAREADAIVMLMGEGAEVGLGLSAAEDAGVPVFAIDAGVTEDMPVLINTASDNLAIGGLTSQHLVDTLGADKKVVVINYDPFEPTRLRAERAREIFAENGWEIVEDFEGDPGDSTGFAKNTILDFLQRYDEGEIDAVWSAWDASALGALQATQEADRTEILVTGVDAEPFAVAEVEKGENWVATVSQDWQGMADATIEVMEACANGEMPAEQINRLPGGLITEDG